MSQRPATSQCHNNTIHRTYFICVMFSCCTWYVFSRSGRGVLLMSGSYALYEASSVKKYDDHLQETDDGDCAACYLLRLMMVMVMTMVIDDDADS